MEERGIFHLYQIKVPLKVNLQLASERLFLSSFKVVITFILLLFHRVFNGRKEIKLNLLFGD